MSLTPAQLNEIANEIYMENFGEKFPGWVEWSSHMKRIAGNCRNDGRIALNKYYYDRYGEEEIILVLRHELAHLYCFRTIGRHTHQNPKFIEILNKLKGTRMGKCMPLKVYVYECPECHKQWFFKTKIKKILSCSECSDGKYNRKYRIQFLEERILEPCKEDFD